jgi:hypothetical protein
MVGTVTCLEKKRLRKKSYGWVSHLSDKRLLKASIVARFCALIIIRATSGLHIPTDVYLEYLQQTRKSFISIFKIIFAYLFNNFLLITRSNYPLTRL